jgi:hypothetical protein
VKYFCSDGGCRRPHLVRKISMKFLRNLIGGQGNQTKSQPDIGPFLGPKSTNKWRVYPNTSKASFCLACTVHDITIPYHMSASLYSRSCTRLHRDVSNNYRHRFNCQQFFGLYNSLLRDLHTCNSYRTYIHTVLHSAGICIIEIFSFILFKHLFYRPV